MTLVPASGRPGSDARSQIGQTRANLQTLITQDVIGPELDSCFELARLAGAQQKGMAALRQQIEAEQPVTIGATLVRDAGVYFSLAAESRMISDIVFTSRQDAMVVLNSIGASFFDSEEESADSMDQATFQSIIRLHAAVVNFLITTARPLPRMLQYQFAAILPTLVISYRLYDDAGRADEVLAENKVVHPAFCMNVGLALSA